MLKYREYRTGDMRYILELFEMSFGKKMNEKYWKWRYLDNVLNKTMIYLATDDEKVVAHYALSPTILYVKGNQFNAGLSMTTMTHPDYRGRGLFTSLANELYNNRAELDVIYGVPNDNSLKGFIKHLNCIHIVDIPVFEIDLRNKETSYFTENTTDIFEVKSFDYKFDELFDDIRKKYDVILSRKAQTLNWRFFDNPVNEYTVLAMENETKVLGYIVMKEFISSDTKIGDIVDVLALDEDIFLELIYQAIGLFKKKNIPVIKIWINDLNYIDRLKGIGFYENNEKYHFIVKNNSNKDIMEINDYFRWYITMSDIDIF